METDKHLLELAARAAGIPAYWSVDGTIQNRPMFVVKAGGKMGTMPYEAEWNPLKDDAAALRLAVKLNINIEFLPDAVRCKAPGLEWIGETCLPCDSDYLGVAHRRAIVRAAAAMGERRED